MDVLVSVQKITGKNVMLKEPFSKKSPTERSIKIQQSNKILGNSIRLKPELRPIGDDHKLLYWESKGKTKLSRSFEIPAQNIMLRHDFEQKRDEQLMRHISSMIRLQRNHNIGLRPKSQSQVYTNEGSGLDDGAGVEHIILN